MPTSLNQIGVNLPFKKFLNFKIRLGDELYFKHKCRILQIKFRVTNTGALMPALMKTEANTTSVNFFKMWLYSHYTILLLGHRKRHSIESKENSSKEERAMETQQSNSHQVLSSFSKGNIIITLSKGFWSYLQQNTQVLLAHLHFLKLLAFDEKPKVIPSWSHICNT